MMMIITDYRLLQKKRKQIMIIDKKLLRLEKYIAMAY